MGFHGGLVGSNGDECRFNLCYDFPFFNGKIHYFDWTIFNSYVSLPEGRMYIGFSQQQVGFKLPIGMASGELLHSYGQLWYRWPINIHKLWCIMIYRPKTENGDSPVHQETSESSRFRTSNAEKVEVKLIQKWVGQSSFTAIFQQMTRGSFTIRQVKIEWEQDIPEASMRGMNDINIY